MSGGTASSPADKARRLRDSLRWFWRGVTGEDAYDRYVVHLRRHHPDRPVPTAAAFWREKYEDMERNPTSRCC